jgi:hypothetical protein
METELDEERRARQSAEEALWALANLKMEKGSQLLRDKVAALMKDKHLLKNKWDDTLVKLTNVHGVLEDLQKGMQAMKSLL